METGYRKPPPLIDAVLTAPSIPRVFTSSTDEYLIVEKEPRKLSIAEVARPMVGLAGMRIDVRSNSPRRTRLNSLSGLVLVRVADGSQKALEFPPGAALSGPVWNASGEAFAVVNMADGGGELWIGDAAKSSIKKIDGIAINGIGPSPRWLPDGRTLIVAAIPRNRGEIPPRPTVPQGPVTQETSGDVAGSWTYQDLLGGPYDEQLFDYYATSQLMLVNTDTGSAKAVGEAGIFADASPSPDGEYLLIASIHRPYSYLYPAAAFPCVFQIWNADGNIVTTLSDAPLQDNVVPDGVTDSPRDYQWKPTVPSTVLWFKAFDGGDPASTKTPRDRIFSLDSPFSGQHQVVATVQQRCLDIEWIENSSLALLRDYSRSDRITRGLLFDAASPDSAQKSLYSLPDGDRYNDPGSPMMRVAANGQYVVIKNGDAIFFAGDGFADDGKHPFLDRLNVKTLEKQRLFRSELQPLETVRALLRDDASQLLTVRQSSIDPPNYYVRSADGSLRAITHFTDPAPHLRKLQRRLVHYKRPDGIDLSFELILPPDYEPGKRLPAFLWMYPNEVNDKAVASQTSNSTQDFQSNPAPHILLAFEGYAVLENATIPIVGPQMTANDTYVEQLVANAKAAIDEAAALDIIDPDRVAVGGHSYGAFSTANLLAHSKLFRAGVAQSGAYNRTLTPFTFQYERRTFWQEPDLYMQMSPFAHVRQLHGALLLVHGQADDNSGTYPMQSERMYQAIRGNGGTARLVMLPLESHGYDAVESNQTVMSEIVSWLERHVRNA